MFKTLSSFFGTMYNHKKMLKNIIEKRRNILRNTHGFAPEKIEYITNFESYYRDKVRSDGCETPRLKQLREFHETRDSLNHREIKKPYIYPHDFDRVSVTTRVNKQGTIKVSVRLPFHELYNKYQSKGVQPPIEERVRLMTLAGYPESHLIAAVKKHENFKKNIDKYTVFLENIFGKK